VNGKVALITGGANGIGAETARRLHAGGAKLVLTDIDEATLTECAADLKADHVMTVVADVRDFAAMQAVADQAVDRFGGIDIVVANAGIATYGSVLHVDPAAFKTLIDVNLLGVFNTVRAALPAVIDRRGYVLIVSSMYAYAPQPGGASYCVSKAGVEQLANTLRIEVAHLGVEVGSAHMGFIDTPMVRDLRSDLRSFTKALSKLPGPMGKTTSVEKCAEAFVEGIQARKRRVNCPGWVGVLRWLRPLLSTQLGEAQVRKIAPELLAEMDAEAAALGRSMSARTEALEKRP